MKEQKLPEDIQSALNDWFGEEILPAHFWKDSDGITFYVIAKVTWQDVYLLRFWRMGGKVAMSQDNIIYDNRTVAI